MDPRTIMKEDTASRSPEGLHLKLALVKIPCRSRISSRPV